MKKVEQETIVFLALIYSTEVSPSHPLMVIKIEVQKYGFNKVYDN